MVVLGAGRERQLGVGDGPVGADLPVGVGGPRSGHGDVIDLGLDAPQQVGDGVADPGAVDPALVVHDELPLEAGLPGQTPGGEQVRGGLALGPGQLEVVLERAAGRGTDGQQADQRDDPGGQDEPPVTMAEVGEGAQHVSLREWSRGRVEAAGPTTARGRGG